MRPLAAGTASFRFPHSSSVASPGVRQLLTFQVRSDAGDLKASSLAEVELQTVQRIRRIKKTYYQIQTLPELTTTCS